MYAEHRRGRDGGRPAEATREIAVVWPSYFPEEVELNIADPKLRLTASLAEFFSSPEGHHFVSYVEDDSGTFFLPIDFEQLRKLCWVPELCTALQDSPKEALLCMGAAVHLAICSRRKDFQLDDFNKINVRLYNHTESTISLRNLKAAYIKKLVMVRGTVVKVSTVKPLVLQLDFTCMKCRSVFTRVFSDGKFSPPVSCSIQGCKSRTFSPIRSTAKLIDFQKIRSWRGLKAMKKAVFHEP